MEKKKQEEQESSELEKEIKDPEKSELEEEVEEIKENFEERIDNNKFQEFIKPDTESFSPVLEKVEAPQESLEQDVASAPIIKEKQEEQIKYSTKYNESDYRFIEERSRRINENLLVQSTPINFEKVGMNLHPQITQNFQINPELQELRRKSEGNLEKDYVVKAERLNREDNKLPFEQTERKYKGRVI
ncbi:hypothetical protein KAJ87_00890 [Candidatus Pacearchaeota archaeon]|nr:hypothetical protein [Candidatus Pacearchaeota archaeon]